MLSKRKWGHWGWCGAVALCVSAAPTYGSCPATGSADCPLPACGTTSPAPETHPDNPTCADLNCAGFDPSRGDGEVKIQCEGSDVQSGIYSLEPAFPGGWVEICVNAAEKTFSWRSNYPMACVFSKGGPNGGNLYSYGEPGATCDTGLHSPPNNQGANAGLSHISFCVQDICQITVEKRITSCPSPGDSPDCATDGGAVPDWPIRIYDAGGSFVAEECTGADGKATFEVGCGLAYMIREVVPILEGAASFEHCPLPVTGFEPCPDLTRIGGTSAPACTPSGSLWGLSGATITSYDEYGLPAQLVDNDDEFTLKNGPATSFCELIGTIFCDDDGNCTLGGLEGGIDGDFTVTATVTSSPDATRVGTDICTNATTDAAGVYICGELGDGEEAEVCVSVPAGWTSTCESIVSGEVCRSVTGTDALECSEDFGFIPDLVCPDDITDLCTDEDECSTEVCFDEPAPDCGTPVCTAEGPNGETITLYDGTGENEGKLCGEFPGPDGDVCPAVSTVTCYNEADGTRSPSCEFDVEVDDCQNPEIDCPDDQEIACDEETDIPVTASDNCDDDVVPVCVKTDDSFPDDSLWSWSFPIVEGVRQVRVTMPFSGWATFRCTATDDCGNNDADNCEFTVTAECLECRFTGGGNDGNIPPKSWGEGDDEFNQWTFGGQAGAPSASDPAFGEWTHHQKSGTYGSFVFHAGTHSAPAETLVEVITCHDPLSCHPARPAPAKQLDFSGVGSIKRGTLTTPDGDEYGKDSLLCFAVQIEDSGEPGNKSDTDETNPGDCPDGGHPSPALDGCDKCVCADWYSIDIWDCADPDDAYHVDGYLHGGNFQIHPLVGANYHGPTCGDE